MRIWRYVSLLLTVGLVVGSIGTASAGEESTFLDYGIGAVTDGEYVVWTQEAFDNGRSGRRLFAQEITTGERALILEGENSIAGLDIERGIVIWAAQDPDSDSSERSVYGYNLHSGEHFEISDIEGNHEDAVISGDIVAWRQMLWNGGNDHSHAIMGRNIETMDEPFVIHKGETNRFIQLDSDRILWQEQDRLHHWRLMTMRIGESEPITIDEGSNISPGGSFGYDISGDLVVYVAGPTEIIVRDLETGDTTIIPAEPYDQRPVINGRFVFWSGNDPDDSIRRVLMGYDLKTHSKFSVHGAASSERSVLSLGGDYLTWTLATDDPLVNEIYLSTLGDTLPTAPRPAPDDENPNRIWFPETGHTAVFGFKNFWEGSGGLPVFGFPLTHEFDELNADSGAFHTVQYFERQRFEYHSEHAGTPYEVLLGRLGVEDAAQRRLLDADDLELVEQNDDTNCQYHEATDLTVCGEFLTYWQSHGLDLGDVGVSFRESLALFGHPVTPDFIDPDTGLETQYFERARFELHPDNPEEHRVLLGRLGADLIDQRDW